MEAALSHLDTAWRDTPSRPASSSWDQPLRLRSSVILSAKSWFGSSLCPGTAALVFCPYLSRIPVAGHQAGWNVVNRRLHGGFPRLR